MSEIRTTKTGQRINPPPIKILSDEEPVPCWWCQVNWAMPGDTLCVRCWGCKTASLSKEECLEDWDDDDE